MKKVLFVLLSLIATCGCQKKEERKHILKLCFNMEPLTLDARKSGDLSSATVLHLLFNGLTELEPNGDVKLALAKSYELSKDKKTYTFHLRDAQWSDNTKITAYDFEYSWKKIIDPSFPALCPQLLYPIKNGEAIAKRIKPPETLGCFAKDANTFVVELENPTPYFLALISFCIFYPIPAHIEQTNPNWSIETRKQFVSSGPFLLEKWSHNNEIILKKNPHFWNKNSIHLNSIQISIVSDENTMLQMYEQGAIDWMGSSLAPIPLDSIPTLMKGGEFKLIPISGSAFCAFNIERLPFNNKNIRRAFSLAIDRKELIKTINQTNDIIASRCLPPILMKNKNRQIVEDNNQQLAKELFLKGLKELNIDKNNLKLTFSYSAHILHKKLAEVLQERWQKVLDVKINMEQMEEKVIIDRFHKHDFHFGLRYWIAQYYDPMNILERFKYKTQSKNYPQWENENYIKLLEQSAMGFDFSQREKILEKAEDLLMEEMPITPIYHFNYAILCKPYVKNITIGPIGNLNFDKAEIHL